MEEVYAIVKNGKLQEGVVPDGTRLIFTDDCFTIITPGGYKFKMYNIYEITYVGQENNK